MYEGSTAVLRMLHVYLEGELMDEREYVYDSGGGGADGPLPGCRVRLQHKAGGGELSGLGEGAVFRQRGEPAHFLCGKWIL